MAFGLSALAAMLPAYTVAGSSAGSGLGSLLGGIAGGIISGGSGLFGSLFSSASSSKEAKKLRKQQMQIWQEQKDLALHAHEYEVADLRRAGLNPILSATGGSGISVPSGSVSAQVPGLDFSGAGDPVVKAFEIASALQKMELMQKQIEGVSSANEGKLLENDARRINNHIARSTSQFAIDEKAFGPSIARANLRKAAADADILHENALYRKSVEGRNLYSAKQYQEAYPRNGSVGSFFNIGGSAIERIFNLIEQKKKQKYGPELWNEAWKDIR